MYSINKIIKQLYESNGVYVGVKFNEEGMKVLEEYFSKKIPKPFPAADMHSTLAYSKTWFDHKLSKEEFKAEIERMHIFKNEKLGHTALVIILKSKDLENRHKQIHKDKNATYDYDEYHPHITVSYDVSSMDKKDLDYILSEEFLKELKSQNIKIEGGKEYTEKLNTEWKPLEEIWKDGIIAKEFGIKSEKEQNDR